MTDLQQEQQQWWKRWQEGRLGFHVQGYNPWLLRYADQVFDPAQTAQSRMLVPLCGKSWDLLWLRSRFQQVVGVELVPKAVHDFFEEHQFVPLEEQRPPFHCFQDQNLLLMQGDIFQLTLSQLDQQPCQAVYDRASLIALPTELRASYVEQLISLLAPGSRILLVTIAFGEVSMKGPPHSVPAAEVEQLFAPFGQVELLEQRDILSESPRFVAAGVTWAHEAAYCITLP